MFFFFLNGYYYHIFLPAIVVLNFSNNHRKIFVIKLFIFNNNKHISTNDRILNYFLTNFPEIILKYLLLSLISYSYT